MHLVIPHKFSQAQAKAKVQQALADAKAHIKDQAQITREEWEGNTFNFAATVQGKEITGTLEVAEKQFVLDAKLPLMWRIFEGRIEKMIEEQVKQNM